MINFSKTTLRSLAKDDFQVLSRTLRNGETKFYQNTNHLPDYAILKKKAAYSTQQSGKQSVRATTRASLF